MKKTIVLTTCTSIILLLSACGEETKENNRGLENPVNTYMDSRVNTIDMAKQSVQESNKKVEEQDKAMKALLGK